MKQQQQQQYSILSSTKSIISFLVLVLMIVTFTNGNETFNPADRLPTMFRLQMMLAAQDGDFDTFHVMHKSLATVSTVTRPDLVSGPILNKQIDTPALFLATFLGHTKFVQQYVEGGYPLNGTVDFTPYFNYWREKRGLSDISVQHALQTTEVKASVLHAAILGGHTELALLLLKSGVSAEGPIGALQPLHVAAATDNVEVINALAKELHNTTLDTTVKELSEVFSALHFASLYGSSNALERLLELGGNPNTNANPTGRTPLFLAAISNSTEIVRILLAKNASCVIEGAEKSILHIPIAATNFEMVEVLLEEGHCDINAPAPNSEQPIHLAAKKDLADYISLLLDHQADIEGRLENFDTPLHVAAKNNALQSAKVLIQRGASLESRNSATLLPLHAAARAGHPEMVEFLLESGANIDALASNYTALEVAILNLKEASVAALIKHGANVTRSEPLSLASVSGNVAIIEMLIQAGADVNARYGEAQLTPLIASCIFGNTNAAQLLLIHGADLNAVDIFGNTPLVRAVFSSFLETISLLVKQPEIEISKQNARGDSALHVAVDKRLHGSRKRPSQVEIVSALILAGADPDVTNAAGETPLHSAVYSDNQELIALVVAAGADLEATDDKGRTALDLAKELKLDTARVTLLLAEQKTKFEAPESCFPFDWRRTISYAVKRRQI